MKLFNIIGYYYYCTNKSKLLTKLDKYDIYLHSIQKL